MPLNQVRKYLDLQIRFCFLKTQSVMKVWLEIFTIVGIGYTCKFLYIALKTLRGLQIRPEYFSFKWWPSLWKRCFSSVFLCAQKKYFISMRQMNVPETHTHTHIQRQAESCSDLDHFSFLMWWFYDSNILNTYWLPVLNLAANL